jgi:hypothetical protein
MNRKLSSDFAILVVVAIALFSGIMFWVWNKRLTTEVSYSQNITSQKNEKNKSENCSKHAYEGEVAIHGWYVFENNEWLLQIADGDLGKLPAGYNKSKVELADGPADLIKKLKSASQENSVEVTIKGFYTHCEGFPMVSVSPGGDVFKKYLTQA